jgi:molecular chaperone GrpE
MKPRQPNPDRAQPEAPADPVPVDEGAEPAADPAASEASAAELERVRRERDDYLAHWQRSQADYQNLRRRMQQDLEASARRAKLPLLLDLLLVLDQLDLALAAPATDGEPPGLRAGIELVREQLVRALENEDVRPIPAGGDFDPSRHQAVAAVEAPGAPPGSVVETLRRGFLWGGQVLRFAQVKVAAGQREAAGAAGGSTGTEPGGDD